MITDIEYQGHEWLQLRHQVWILDHSSWMSSTHRRISALSKLVHLPWFEMPASQHQCHKLRQRRSRSNNLPASRLCQQDLVRLPSLTELWHCTCACPSWSGSWFLWDTEAPSHLKQVSNTWACEHIHLQWDLLLPAKSFNHSSDLTHSYISTRSSPKILNSSS